MNRRNFFKAVTGIIAGFFVSKSSKATSSHNWTQITISDEDETIRIYLNGQEVGTPSGEFSISFWVSSGKMNNVNLYNRALNPEEIEKIYEEEI